MNYYKLQKTQKDKQFFYEHSGYFNFWDVILILRDKRYATKDCVGLVLVNRTNQEFHGCISEEEKIIYPLYLNKSIREHKPEEMFKDFPELEDFVQINLQELNFLWKIGGN